MHLPADAAYSAMLERTQLLSTNHTVCTDDATVTAPTCAQPSGVSCITAPNLVRACTRCIWPRLRAGSPPRWGGGGDSALHRRGLGTPGCGCGHGEHDLVRGCPGVRSACRSFMDVPGHSLPPKTNIDARLLCAESDDPRTPTWLPYHPWRRVARCWFEPMGDASRPGVSHVFHTCDTAPGHDTHYCSKKQEARVSVV